MPASLGHLGLPARWPKGRARPDPAARCAQHHGHSTLIGINLQRLNLSQTCLSCHWPASEDDGRRSGVCADVVSQAFCRVQSFGAGSQIALRHRSTGMSRPRPRGSGDDCAAGLPGAQRGLWLVAQTRSNESMYVVAMPMSVFSRRWKTGACAAGWAWT
jgi:hypothetical protein